MLDTILLQIAKTAILSKLDSNYTIDESTLIGKYPFLAQNGAAFVTLNKKNHELRGCIGSIIAHRNLLHDIIQNAISAAFNDPRFYPLGRDELNNLHLEVSVLTPPQPLAYNDYDDLKQKIRPDIDGVIIKYGEYQGTFLPQVWEQLPQSEDFLEHLAYKAGANPTIYSHHPDIYTYQVEAIEEDFDAILPL